VISPIHCLEHHLFLASHILTSTIIVFIHLSLSLLKFPFLPNLILFTRLYVTGHDKTVLLGQKYIFWILIFPESPSFPDHFDVCFISLRWLVWKLWQLEFDHVSEFYQNLVLR
jgi:hypothetical protein